MFSLLCTANLRSVTLCRAESLKESEDTFEGACACGEVRYRMLSRPLYVHCCHCRWCQRETGSAFVLNAFLESDRLELLSGDPVKVGIPSASGQGQVVVRCAKCQVALWSHYAGLGEKMSMVRVGTLDEPDLMPPDIHIYTNSRQPWVVLPSDVPVVPEYYRRSQYWPEESLARRAALIE